MPPPPPIFLVKSTHNKCVFKRFYPSTSLSLLLSGRNPFTPPLWFLCYFLVNLSAYQPMGVSPLFFLFSSPPVFMLQRLFFVCLPSSSPLSCNLMTPSVSLAFLFLRLMATLFATPLFPVLCVHIQKYRSGNLFLPVKPGLAPFVSDIERNLPEGLLCFPSRTAVTTRRKSFNVRNTFPSFSQTPTFSPKNSQPSDSVPDPPFVCTACLFAPALLL